MVRADGCRAAVEAALEMAVPGDVVLVLYEKMVPVLRLLSELGAVPADPAPTTRRRYVSTSIKE